MCFLPPRAHDGEERRGMPEHPERDLDRSLPLIVGHDRGVEGSGRPLHRGAGGSRA